MRISNLNPSLRTQLTKIAKHFGRPVQVTSGCRSKFHNRKVGGVNGSFHIRCLAADFRVAGISKARLASYVRSMPSSGGVGVYCGKGTVHLDVGPRRSWYGKCRSRRKRHIARAKPSAAPDVTGSILPKYPSRLGISTSQSGNSQSRGSTSLGGGIENLLAKSIK